MDYFKKIICGDIDNCEKSKQILLKYKKLSENDRIFNISIKQHEQIMINIRKAIKLDIKIKDMRSTFMTRCDELNIPERVYQAWVGHKPGSKVTKTTYVKHNTDIDYIYINAINNGEIELKSNSLKTSNKK